MVYVDGIEEKIYSRRPAPARGQAFLALMFLVGGIVVLIGITIAFLANSFIDTGYGYRASTQAEAVATSGAQDALLQLDRNSGFSSSGYGVGVGSSTATVTVTQSSPSAGFVTVLSTATVSNRTRKINVVLSVNATTSQTSVVSWAEIQ